eukprot:gene46279-61894_t
MISNKLQGENALSATWAEPAAAERTTGATRIGKVGMLGLGIMGSAMSANLVQAGFEVHGYDPVASTRERLAADGGAAWDEAASAIRPADFLLLSLPSEAALESVTAEILAAGRPGLIVAETSTLPVE